MTPTRESWRLLVDPPADGAWNMAVDEALLDAQVADPTRPPILRLYAWRPAAVSLGRGQPAAAAHDPTFLRREGIDLVRRPTGGQAVLHEEERTYAVIAPLRSRWSRGGVIETYAAIAGVLAAALERLGLAPDRASRSAPAREGAADPSCFARPSTHEILIGGRKLIGSAQLRRRGAMLQHGSILLRADPSRVARAIGVPGDDGMPGFTDLSRVLGRPVSAHEVDRALLAAFEQRIGAAFEARSLDTDEALHATRLRCWKYDSVAWTYDGRIGGRERRWGPDLAGQES